MSDDALKAARLRAVGLEPEPTCARSGATFEPDPDTTKGGTFVLPFLGESVRIRFPGFHFAADVRLPSHVQALLVYYLAGSVSSHPSGEWCSLAELPDGRFYVTAFQGYTGDALARRFANVPEELPIAIAALGGRALEHSELATNADSAWLIPVLPRVPVALVWWNADDEFSARAELLYDRTARDHLTIDGCAVAGSWLTSVLAAKVEDQGS